MTLKRCAPHLSFDPIIGTDDVTRPKPAPEGLLKICAQVSARQPVVYRRHRRRRALRAEAGVPFIGIAAPANPRYDELVKVLKAEEAVAVLDDINQLESVVCA